MHEPSLMKGVAQTLCGHGAKLTIPSPAPSTAVHRWPPCTQLSPSRHRGGPVTADQQAKEGGCREDTPRKPGPMSAAGEGRAWGSGSPAMGPALSDTVLHFLGRRDTFLLFVNLAIHMSVACCPLKSPRRHPQRPSGGSHRATWLALPSQCPGPASCSHLPIQGLVLNTQAGQELRPRGRQLSGTGRELVPPQAAAAP